MRVPLATYRVQFNSGFRFDDARKLVPYLHGLGVTHLYASPIFTARAGSTHGYDITDPSRLNPELGDATDLDALVAALHDAGMDILLDIVPNHLSASSENPWWMDVLENGGGSQYAAYFDILWEQNGHAADEKILLPILGDSYGSALESGTFQLGLDQSGFFVGYYDWKLPLDPNSWPAVLDVGLEHRNAPPILKELIESLGRLPARTSTDWEMLEKRRAQAAALRDRLWQLYTACGEVRELVDGNIRALNGRQGDPRSFDRLDEVLARQAYSLASWRVGREKINYRRFFDISELVSLRSEDLQVYGATHALLFDLVRTGKVGAVRVDHIDGLYDPREYLSRLQASLKEASGAPANGAFYVLVEKILSNDETLPGDWNTAGTTGYDFLNAVNGLFVDPGGLAAFTRFYANFTGCPLSFDDVVQARKKQVMEELFPGEISALRWHLGLLAEHDRHARDLSPRELEHGLIAVTAALPVYRTYIRNGGLPERDRIWLDRAVEAARQHAPTISPAVFDFLGRVLRLEYPASMEAGHRREWLRFVMRWQQLSGPVMAKGLEDTALYAYNRLVSLNEVGARLEAVSPGDFHRFNTCRQARWPYAMNATSTHDTKRSEDVRARISVLSEMPRDWTRYVARWSRWNRPRKRAVRGKLAPDANEELLIYQTLVGAWPFEEAGDGFPERLKAYVIKAAREAKVHTNWLHPDQEYEDALLSFIDAVLDPASAGRLLSEFHRVHRRTSFYGAINSLAQVLLKIASPGVPDFYQSTSNWDFSLVDPDNRRPVDFPRVIELLERLRQWEHGDVAPLVRSLLENWRDGGVKLFLTYRAVTFRTAHPQVFLDGDYVPLEPAGARGGNVIAFARRTHSEWVVAVVPRLLLRHSARERWPIGRRYWRDTSLPLPGDAPAGFTNALTGEQFVCARGVLRLADALRTFPVALLWSTRI
jgi:(1->4)-alpha-D-glucan 1-alpha-D-glucosylmutase